MPWASAGARPCRAPARTSTAAARSAEAPARPAEAPARWHAPALVGSQGLIPAGRVSMTWVLFDYGGVICELQSEADRARLASASGGPAADFEAAYWRYRLDYDRAALDVTTYWQQVAADLGRSYTHAEIAELSRLDTVSWLTLQPGTVDLITALAAAGQRLALLSNAPADVAEAVQELPLASHFEHLVFSCALKSAKPDPECFQATLALLGAEPGDVVFLDDRPENVAGAAALGIKGIQFTDAPAARAGLARYGIAAG